MSYQASPRPAAERCISRRYLLALASACIAIVGCSGGSDVLNSAGTGTGGTTSCDGSCADASTFLSAADVQQVIAQAVAEAQARSALATIAVVDRVGNVLAVYRMGDAASHEVTVSSALNNGTPTIVGGLENIALPTPATTALLGHPATIDHAAAIAKAVTGAFLSSEGNAFSTRTANQIVQQHFNPGVQEAPSGPLFGVQFSQLPCSDFSSRYAGGAAGVGPQRSPLGLAADAGGFPLYKNGTVVGGVGVIADGVYGLDADITNIDTDLDEGIAMAATYGFSAPVERRADRIVVGGNSLRFTDVEFAGLKSNPASAPVYTGLGSVGAIIAVPGYTDGSIRAGTPFGQPASGIRSDGNASFPGQDAFIFVDAANTPRFPARAGTDAALLGAQALSQTEVQQILSSALDVANRARAQIRAPLNTPARVTISVVDTQGEILGMVRGRDAPVFGADVSLQKARTAALASSATAADFIAALPNAKYLDTSVPKVSQDIVLGNYVSAARAFVGIPTLLADGQIAFTDRANGNLSRPFYPDGIDGSNPGPYSKPPGQWSPFSTGLQLDLSINAIEQHVLYVAGLLGGDAAVGCTGVDLSDALNAATLTVANHRAANGLQIFPGSVPIYRNGTLIGGVGVSGDGVDQDDMVAFLGLNNAAAALSGGIGNAPSARRADTLTPQGVRLRYIECPQAPFLDSTEDNVCDGK